MTGDAQALYVNAVPLLVLAAVYLAAAAAMAPALWRERTRFREVGYALALVFPAIGTAALLAGIGVVRKEEPLAGSLWLGLGAAVAALVPGVLFLLGWRERGDLLPGSRPEAVARGRPASDERRRAFASLARGLARATEARSVARLLADTARATIPVDLVGLLAVDDGHARGIAAWLCDEELAAWPQLSYDLDEPSLVASTVFEASPSTVYDLAAAVPPVPELTEHVGSGSAAFVPLVVADGVVGVLVAATSTRPRPFSSHEVAALQELAAEAALALERTRSGSALEQALERERLVGRIASRVRSEHDLDAVLGAAVEETAAALDVARCFIRLGDEGQPMTVRAEWRRGGAPPIGRKAGQLAASNLAARERRTVAIGDVAEAAELDAPELGSRESMLGLGTRAVLATPIAMFGEVAGVLAAHREEPGPWTGDEIVLLEAVSRELGLAIHTARLLGENEHRLKQRQALLDAAQAITAELRAELVLQRLVDEVAALLGGDAADCYLLDERRGMLRCAAVRGLPDELVGFEFPATKGTSGRALAEGRPVIAGDYGTEGEPVPSAAYEGFATAIVAPVVSGERRLGVLGVAARDAERHFDEADVEVLEAFATLAALALRNAEAFEERARQARIQRGFYRVAAALAEPLSVAATYEALAVAAAEALGGTSAAVVMPRADRLSLTGGHELHAALTTLLEHGVAADSALASAAADDRVLAAPRLGTDDRFEPGWRAAAAEAGAASLLAVPVRPARDGGGEAGLVLVFFAEERTFSDDDLELAGHLAGAAHGALERSGQYEGERIARSLAQQLARVGTLLTAELEPSAVLADVVQQAPKLVGADACAIRLLEGDELVVGAAEGVSDEELVGTRAPATGWLSGDVVQSGSPVAIPDAGGDDRLRAADTVLAEGFRAYLGVPLGGPEAAVHGVLSLYGRKPRMWRPDEIEALRALAGNAAAALANAELYQRVALEKERSFAILANIADGIVAVNREGNVVLWNRAAEDVTGVPGEEALGRTPLQVLGRNLEAGDGPGRDRLVPILRSGEEVWLSVTEAVMRDPAGAVSGRIYAFRDISSDRLVEQMKSDFVSTVSQELRRPLTSIYGFAETLLRRDVLFGEEEQRTFLGYIASESERLTTIVDALLNVARLDAGDLQVSLAPVDVGAVVGEVVAAQAESDAHDLVVDVADGPLSAEADADKLRQVLGHLLDNAVRYSPAGGTVTVAARRRGDQVELRVTDEGIGIPTAEHERIFRKFYRADAGSSGAGPGLGLFLAQGLVGAMAGHIRVDSREGEGASFSFELPAAARMLESEESRVGRRIPGRA